MRNALAGLTLLVCVPAHAQMMRARVFPPGFQNQQALDTLGRAVQVGVPAGRVFTAAIAAFGDLKIPVTSSDSLHGMVANLGIRQSRTLAGSQMSRWLSCGEGMTGPNADSFRIYAALAVLLDKGAADSTKVQIGFLAGSEDMQGNMKAPVPCGSTGAIEEKLMGLIMARLSKP